MNTKEQRHGLVGQADIWKEQGEFQIKFLKQMGLKTGDNLLDIGCGTIRGGIHLIKYLDPSQYHGLDSRKEMITEAKKELEEECLVYKQPKLQYFDGNFEEAGFGGIYDFIWSFAVLIHMEDNILNDCFKFVSKHLVEDGVFYANVNITDKPFQRSWEGFPLMFRTLEFYKNIADENGLELENIGTIHSFGHPNTVENDPDKDKFQQVMLKITLKK